MRIDFTNLPVDASENSKPGRAGPGIKASAGSVTSGVSDSNGASSEAVDQANFSFDPTRVQSLQAQILAQPEIRQTMVQALQESISGNEYSVLPGQIADSMIAELSGAQG